MQRSRHSQRQVRFEAFEPRLVMTGIPVGDFALEAVAAPPLEHFAAPAQPLADVHSLTGVRDVWNAYGFQGHGQTVAVIDSGIAWDHWALGRGFGAGYRVVGGWDFTEENDANPYDDGPAGFHGTHVAGIIGSSDARNSGVAPGVDLVALRVFNDQGAGYFEWVERALQWVHQHRNAFENPITVVNLSLGTAWNSASLPAWSMLEDEFAQLKADGVFISVAAGNAFQQYAAAGLSYPAASPHVVPVSSITASGNFSSFSQRHPRALAAPGQSITSTVPDHIYGVDGVANDFGAASGTSMAAPYVAGAAVLVREAMQFVGVSNITQDAIYEHLRTTADVFYDTATQANYFRINVLRAIDALMPGDDYGSTWDTGYHLGAVRERSIEGAIGRLQDADCFTFTADVSGTMHLNITASAKLSPQLSINGVAATMDDGQLSFSVVAGQQYSIMLASSAGIGHYALGFELESAVQTIDWGTVDYQWLHDQKVDEHALYQFTATRSGILSVEAFTASSGNDRVQLELYDGAGTRLGTSSNELGAERIDIRAVGGNQYFLRVTGASTDVDFRLANILDVAGDTLTVFGTDHNDDLTYTASTGGILVQGIQYQIARDEFQQIRFEAGAGHDQIQLREDAGGAVVAELRTDTARVTNGARSVHVTGAETVIVQLSGGTGNVLLVDSASDDVFTVTPSYAEMIGGGLRRRVEGFTRITATSHAGGLDTARLEGSAGNDTLTAGATTADFGAGGQLTSLRGFEQIAVDGGAGGYDSAWLTGSSGNDRLSIRPGSTSFVGDTFALQIAGFEDVRAVAGLGGTDRAVIYDSSGDDVLTAGPLGTVLLGSGYRAAAAGFSETNVFSTAGGRDTAVLFDSAGNDRFQASPGIGSMEGDGYRVSASGFDLLVGHSNAGGRDVAFLYDSRGDDRLSAHESRSILEGTGYRHEAHGFSRVNVYASTGNDRAEFFGSAGSDRFYARPQYAYLQGPSFYNFARGFDVIRAEAGPGGIDIAYLYDGSTNDRLVVRPDEISLVAEDIVSTAVRFGRTYSYATRGENSAEFWDSVGDDRFMAMPGTSTLSGAGFYHYAQGFQSVVARATAGGRDEAVLYDSSGNDRFISRQTEQWFAGRGFEHGAVGFDITLAYSRSGVDRAEFFDAYDEQLLRLGNDVVLHRGTSQERVYDFAEYLALNRATDSIALAAWDEVFEE